MSEDTKKRASVAKKEIAEDNSGVSFKFSNGHNITVGWSDIPDAIKLRLGLHGLSQKIGDSYAGVKGNVDEAIESAQAIAEMLMNGEWTEKAEGVGAAPSMVVEAIVASLIAQGETVDDARRAAIVEKVKVKETREGALKNPLIKSQYELIRLQKAQERVAAAQKAAAEAGTQTLEF